MAGTELGGLPIPAKFDVGSLSFYILRLGGAKPARRTTISACLVGYVTCCGSNCLSKLFLRLTWAASNEFPRLATPYRS